MQQIIYFLVVLLSYTSALDFGYHKYDNLTTLLNNFTRTYTNISPSLYSIGKSIQGRELWVVEVSRANRSKIGVPNVKLVGNIHGNEAVGREVLLHFLEYLGTNYLKDQTITWLLNNTIIHILPSMNPDGYEIAGEGICTGAHGRTNARYMDLNRNFPDYYRPNLLPPQPESLAVQEWMDHVPFILSASLHGGALVANYPFDTVEEFKWEALLRKLTSANTPEEAEYLRNNYIASLPTNPPSIAPDDDVFVRLASVYANKHTTMHLGKACPDEETGFRGGITNGAEWYPFRGGMQDFNYFKHGCLELTLEISCCKYPHSRELPNLWEENKLALVDFVAEAHRGVTGRIVDSQTKEPIKSATLQVVGRNMSFATSQHGEFWRLLLPGTYQLLINATGYHIKIAPFEVTHYGNDTYPALTTIQIPLVNISLPDPDATTTVKSTTILLPTIPVSTTFNTHSDGSSTHHSDSLEYVHNDSLGALPLNLKSTGLEVDGFRSDAVMSAGSTMGTVYYSYWCSVIIVYVICRFSRY